MIVMICCLLIMLNLRSVPGSVVELETEEHNGDVCFMRFFVSLKPNHA
jgi:hypothetical protein